MWERERRIHRLAPPYLNKNLNNYHFANKLKFTKITFQILFPQTALDNYTFLPFSVFLAIFWTFTYKKVPETKNKTFEEILALFRHNNGRFVF